MHECTFWMLTKCLEKKPDGDRTKMLRSVLNKSKKQHSQNNSCTAIYFSSHKVSKSDKQDMPSAVGEVRTNSWVASSTELQHIDALVLVDQ